MGCSAVFDLGHCLSMSILRDNRLKWVNIPTFHCISGTKKKGKMCNANKTGLYAKMEEKKALIRLVHTADQTADLGFHCLHMA